jgi:anti-anti-sigma factor
MLFAFSQSSFEIRENENVVEMKVSGELTAGNVSAFRSSLLKLLQHGKSKYYKLNLTEASAMDDASIQLICKLIQEMTSTKTKLMVHLPKNPDFFSKKRQLF